MAEAGVGVDIVQISRMERIRQVTPGFFTRVFTAEEVRFCETSSRPMAQYACRFAAREAVLKAMGTGFRGVGRTRPRAKQTAQDEKQRIAQSFREARSVLDELERVQSGDETLENEER